MLFLPPRFQKAIAFFYIKGDTLFGGLSHPGYKMELNYNKDLVKSLLKEIIKVDIGCRDIFENIKKVEFFVSKFHTPAPLIESKDTDPKYRELATGEFTLNVSDKELKELFERIKDTIELNNQES